MGERLLHPGRLADLLTAILEADGCETREARIVGDHLVDASLRGHDSHGVIRIMRYHQWLRSGRVKANRELRMISDSGAMLHLDGQDGMGQRLSVEATALGIERAQRHGLALVALRRAGHVGRIGAYAEQACAAGLVSIHFVNVAGSRLVAPFGSAGRAISTAPVAIGVPHGDGDDFVLDFATSYVAEGKALVAGTGGKPLPADALITGEGERTADPRALYGPTLDTDVPDPCAGAGALRTMGDHKGSGLALACELLAGALTGNGTNGPADHPFGNGMFSILVRPASLDDLGGFAREVAEYVAYVRDLPPEAGVDRVRIPGDPERERLARRRASGLPVPSPVAEGIAAIAGTLGLAGRLADLDMG
ncbi:malate/lactate/ureidoglycolate dehydrogenase [Paralimibaculum aggregatum]|uniref:Malate/lactate/ureidoglycolate dehydrogenase n=1 Tax=Paralimibaculum aggregatum TaxID=3036245 RepID=A0ABQ6LSV1_9RHOB|nr:Ldh family oxidoreductase [Limibaculum sp. NKW23]GMG85158.1 malate/lactate/ureidoglycolate dehydrogenase [Limibaculum sp. NKW23]